MGRRLDLHEILCGVLGSRNVYFQPPESVKMGYPCIVYERSEIRSKHADDKPYLQSNAYTVTVIDRDPDSLLPAKIAAFPLCSFNRHFTSDQLHHDVFKLYY